MGEMNVSKNKRRKMGFMFLLGIILVFISVMLFNYQRYLAEEERERKETEERRQKDIAQGLEDKKENEKSYPKIEEIFYENEELLSDVIEEFNKTDLINLKKNLIISFEWEQEPNWQGDISTREEIYFYKGEMIENTELCSQDTFDIIKENEELYASLKEMAEDKVIGRIRCSAESKEIDFYINTDKTPFVETNNGSCNFFMYSTASNLERYGYRHIKDYWYMQIPPRPE